MSDTVIAAALNALYDQGILNTYLAAEIAANRLYVSDGPPISKWDSATILVLGAGPVQDDESETTLESNWSSMAVNGTNADVDEIFQVPCGITTILGESNMRAARATAFAVYAAYAAFLRGTTLGIPQVMWCYSTIGSVGQRPTADGAEVLIRFNAYIRTRI